jgi:hypothetical protein
MSVGAQPNSGRFRFLSALAGAVAIAAALALLIAMDLGRAKRVAFVSHTESWSVGNPARDPHSPTGYELNRRHLVVPGGHAASFRWIVETQQALADPDWRPHRIAYENYPHGRDSNDTAPYRWWFTLIARMDHLVSSRPLPLAVEHVALYVDPLLLGLLLLSGGVFVCLRFGAAAGAAAVLFLAAVFPLAATFAPGAPDPHTLVWVLIFWSVLPLIASDRRKPARWRSIVAGIFGGLALWTDRFTAEPVIAGLILGGAGAILRWPPSAEESSLVAWRAWGLAGGVTCLAAYFLEFFPGHPGWSVDSIHPLHAIAWFGAGELLHRFSAAPENRVRAWDRRGLVCAGLAGLAAISVPLARLLSNESRFLADDPFVTQLANRAHAVAAPNFFSWLVRDGFSAPLTATCLPLLIAAAAIGLLATGRIPRDRRAAIALALGPVLVATALAFVQLRWWSGVDVLLACLVVTVVVAMGRAAPLPRSWLWAAGCVVMVLPGIRLLPQPAGTRGSDPLDDGELQAVVARDLAYWLTQQNGAEPPVVFTTPGLSDALAYYGSARVIASLAAENHDGLAAAGRIASASTWTEASTLLESRQVAYVILPSWDSSLGRLAQMARQLPAAAPVPENSLYINLRNWNLPPWLRLLTYHVPKDLGGGRHVATVFGVQPQQDEILSVCRLADYFVEMGMLDRLPPVREKLLLYPHSLPALAALAQVDLATGNQPEYDRSLQKLIPELSRRASRLLPVDRRISLAALLLQSDRRDAARQQTEQSLARFAAADLSRLSTGQIVRLIALSDVFGLAFPDPQLRAAALARLPPSLRAKFGGHG